MSDKLKEIMALIDAYANQRMLNNEYDNRSDMKRAREAVLEALKEALK